MNDPRFAALLLAGGNSSRMGSPKALLDFGGEPLWRHQLAKLTALAPDELFISVPRDLAMPIGPWTLLHDAEPQLGPLAGLAAAYRAMTADFLVVLAIDLSAMSSAYLRGLCARARRSGKGQVPQQDGRYLGLAAVYSAGALDLLEAHLHSEDRSLQSFVRGVVSVGFVEAQPLDKNDSPLFTNMNSPDEYRAAVELRTK